MTTVCFLVSILSSVYRFGLYANGLANVPTHIVGRYSYQQYVAHDRHK